MKTTNILIPTDFSVASLNAVNVLLEKTEQRFNIVLVHFLQLSDSISELLMLNRRSREYQYITPEFEEQLNTLRQNYPGQVTSLCTEFFYGNTVAVLKNYLEAKQIDTIVILQGHTYAKLTKNSIDPSLLIQRSGCKVVNAQAVVRPMYAVVPEIEERELAHQH